MPHFLDEICANCGKSKGSHLACAYYSDHYKQSFPTNYCPDPDCRMAWDKGPGTTFKPTGTYKERKSDANT
jgi:ribosomal protein L32